MSTLDRSYRGPQPLRIVPGRWHYATNRKFTIGALCGPPFGENLTDNKARVTCAKCLAIIARYAARPERLAQLVPVGFIEARDRFAFKGILPAKTVLAAIERAKTTEEGVRS